MMNPQIRLTDKIIGTFLNRVLTTAIMFAVVVINSNNFGAEGTGTIAVIILGLTLLQVFNNFVGGSALVYLVPHRNNFQLLMLSYGWMLISNALGIFLLGALDFVPHEHRIYLFILSIIYNLYFIHISVMQGKEDIKLFNILQLSQAVLLILGLATALLLQHWAGRHADIRAYLAAFLFSYLLPAIASTLYVARRIRPESLQGAGTLLFEMVKLGFWTQMANLAQLLTYRVNYYFIQKFTNSDKALGIYDLGTKISEAVWIIPKSICVVLYARVSNCQEEEYTKRTTLLLLKFVLAVVLAAVLVLWILPPSVIAWIFGPDFSNSKPVINSLLPGIVSLSCMSILSHYFAGYGKFHINAISSFIGFAVTALLGVTWLAHTVQTDTTGALQVAGHISSIAYTCSFLFTLTCFIHRTHATAHDFLITRNDIKLLKENILSLSLSKKKKQP